MIADMNEQIPTNNVGIASEVNSNFGAVQPIAEIHRNQPTMHDLLPSPQSSILQAAGGNRRVSRAKLTLDNPLAIKGLPTARIQLDGSSPASGRSWSNKSGTKKKEVRRFNARQLFLSKIDTTMKSKYFDETLDIINEPTLSNISQQSIQLNRLRQNYGGKK